jgi:hypothetical protein
VHDSSLISRHVELSAYKVGENGGMCNEIGAVAIFYILTFIRLHGRQNVARL